MPIDFNSVEHKVLGYSQKCQDAYLKHIFDNIGVTNRYYVEFGAYDGIQMCNTWYFKNVEGWDGLLLDSEFEDHSINLYKEYLTRDNILDIFSKYSVPKEFDLLVIDTDGMDYWFLMSVLSIYSPRVVMVECNIRFNPEESYVLKYNENWRWDGRGWYGASPLAIKQLAEKDNYFPAVMLQDDMVLMRGDCISEELKNKKWTEIYPSSNYDIYRIFVDKQTGEPTKMVESEWIKLS